MSNPVPPSGGAYPPPSGEGAATYPPPAGQPGQQPYQPGQPHSDQPFPGQPFPGQPAPGEPYAGQPYEGAPGQPYQGQPGQPYPGQPYPGQPGQPGFPPAGQPPHAFSEFPTEKKKGGFKRIGVRIIGGIVAFLVIFGIKYVAFGDKAKDAKAGDCIASDKAVKADDTTKTGAKVVDCSSDKAKFVVVARVDGQTDVNSKACDQYFKENEHFFVFSSSDGSTGYLLCLRPKA